MKPSALALRTDYSFAEVHRAGLTYAYQHQRPVAAWRLPRQSRQHLIVDLFGQGELPPLPLELLPAGFIAHPFQEATPASFIRADLHATSADGHVAWGESSEETNSAQQDINRLLRKTQALQAPYSTPNSEPVRDTARQQFTDVVREAVRAIEDGRFHKVVPSRQKSVPLASDFDLATAFQHLCEAYPDAFVSMFSLPGIGTWLGASPETLVSTEERDGRATFRTMALAGTQVAQGDNPLKNAIWRQKEIEEQAMVSRYIINCFKQIRLRDFDEYGPKTVAAGNLLHLRTDFKVDMNATNFADLGSTMLKLLHPTSAVCGMPKAPALAFLRAREAYDRAFFSGYLGPTNVEEATHVFVNLRCAQLHEQTATLYAGAGVTIDSEPEKEWQETEAKMQTLLEVINKKP